MAVIKRAGSFGVQVYDKGTRVWIGTYSTWREAKDAEREAMGSKHVAGRETVAEFCDRYVRDFNSVNSDGTLRWSDEHARSLPSALRPFIARFGNERMSRFPNRDALPWASSQKHFTLKAVRALMNDAVKSHVAPDNPFASLGLERSRGRRDIVAITEAELDLLAECARDVIEDQEYGEIFSALITWQGLVGTRQIGAFNLRPDDVDAEARSVYVRRPGKKVAPRTIFVPPKALAAVQRMPQRLGAEWLFTAARGGKLSKATLHATWNPIRIAFDRQLDPRRAEELRDARPQKGYMQFHELRHAAATAMARRGVSRDDAAWQLTQSDDGDLVRRVYTHLTDQERHGFLARAFSDSPAEEREATG